MQVSSVGGGLPLIVVGVVAIAIASFRGPGGPDGASGPNGPGEDSPDSTTQEQAEGGSAACFDQYFVNVPNDRIATLEEGAQDVDVIGPSQPKEGTVGIRLDVLGKPIGALRFQFFPR